MTRVVIDPGVLVSAFISPRKAAPALLVDAVLDGSLDVLVCSALIDELTDVLGREKFADHAAEGRAAAFIAALRDRATMTEDRTRRARVKTADPDDDYLLALAETHDADADRVGRPASVGRGIERAAGAHATRAGRPTRPRICGLTSADSSG